MARFGYALGLKAESQTGLLGWQPGDEFEAARKKSQASTTMGSSLFDDLPQSRVVHYEMPIYPPPIPSERMKQSPGDRSEEFPSLERRSRHRRFSEVLGGC